MMMAQQQRRTRAREITGPTPCSVAIRARPPNKRPPEHLILERRRQEEKLQRHMELTNFMEAHDLKNEWERNTDRKIQQNTIRRRVNTLLQANQFSIEDRREKLRILLQTEQNEYLDEMDAKKETVIERQAKMRERAKELKDKREAERLQYVQRRYDEQFMNQCEELRSTLSKRNQDIVAAERFEQLKIKDEIQEEEKRNERMYADLWERDMLAKAAREEKEAREQHERNQEVLDVLRKQMSVAEEQKQEGKKLKIEEAELLREQQALRKLEEQRKLEEKIHAQQETRNLLDRSLKLKMQKKAKEEQEQLAFDLKMLEQLLEESRNEAKEQMQRKKELQEEDRRYREYLCQLMLEEKKKQQELEAFIQTEVEKQWQKRLDQWKLEREARRKLLDEVLGVRKEQVMDRLAQNEIKQLEAHKEREGLQIQIAENQRLEKERVEKMHRQNQQYQHDLQGQITYNRQIREFERNRENEEFVLGQQAEREYQHKLKNHLDHPVDYKMHPMRRMRTADLI